MVVWSDDLYAEQDGDGTGVFGQRFDSAGSPLGGEFQVNTYTTGNQGEGAVGVAAAAAGHFVVVWGSGYDGEQDGNSSGVFGQRFDSGGGPLGGEFQVNTYTTGAQSDYKSGVGVAADAAGNFVVVWSSYPQDGDRNGVFAQRYDSSGNPLGGEFQVNTYATGGQGFDGDVVVAADPMGNFVVAWHSYDGSFGDVFARRYDSNGSPLGGEFQVNTYTTFEQGYRSIAVAKDGAGNFVVAWDSYSNQDGDSVGVFAQRYDSAGGPLGGEFQVNTYTLGKQGWGGYRDAAHAGIGVAADAAGDFVVVWDSGYNDYGAPDGDGYGVFGQRYDSNGAPIGSEFQVNTYTTGDQTPVAVAADPAGNFLVAWASDDLYGSGPDGSWEGVFAQRFLPIAPPETIPGLSWGGAASLGLLLTLVMGRAGRRRVRAS